MTYTHVTVITDYALYLSLVPENHHGLQHLGQLLLGVRDGDLAGQEFRE